MSTLKASVDHWRTLGEGKYKLIEELLGYRRFRIWKHYFIGLHTEDNLVVIDQNHRDVYKDFVITKKQFGKIVLRKYL